MKTVVKQTSREAHQMIIPLKQNLKATILSSMEEGMLYTFRDLSVKSGLKEAQVWKRLSEMRDNDKTIEEAGNTSCRYTGAKMTAWKKVTPRE